MPDLFVSYASVDRSRTMQIIDAVQSLGLEIWVDQAGIAGGSSYGGEIANALRDARAMLLIASDASLSSKNVRQEIMLAWRYDRPIIPLILHPLVFPDDVAYWLEGAQWIEVLERPAAEWMPKLRQALSRHGLAIDQPVAPAIRSFEPAPSTFPGNIPATATPILGREREIAELIALLSNGRAITLTGPGGTGKTRLAIEVARRVGPSYAGGAWFLDLSPVRDPELLLPSIADLLAIDVPPDGEPLASVVDALRDRPTLLVLDNLEQIDGAAVRLEPLLSAAPDLILLTTSRSPLHLPNEWVYPVPQLPLPDLDRLPTPIALLENPAIGLFVARAQQVRPDFQLIDGNARAVAEICHRLDGLPLAIEIAAARTRMLPPATILTRLGSRLNLLTRGSASSARQQTLRDTIAWSYHLLDPEEQAAFRQFAVFAGGASVDAAEAVVGPASTLSDEERAVPAALDVLEGLIDQSLLQLDSAADGSVRLRMLETIREYAQEELAGSATADWANQRHASYFLDFMQSLGMELRTSRDAGAVRSVRAELGNLRAALLWNATAGAALDRLRLAVAMFDYWRIAGPYAEAEDELNSALAAIPKDDSVDRAGALGALGWLAAGRGDLELAETLLSEALRIYAAAAMLVHQAEMEFQLAMVAELGARYPEATVHHRRRLELHRQLGDEAAAARVEHDLGVIARYQGDYAASAELIARGLDSYRKTADAQKIVAALIDLTATEMLDGRADASLRHIDEALILLRTMEDDHALLAATLMQGRARQLAGLHVPAREALESGRAMAETMGDRYMLSLAFYGLGATAVAVGQWDEARDWLQQSFRLAIDAGDQWRLAEVLESMAEVAARQEDLEQAARLLGMAERQRAESGAPLPPAHRTRYDETVSMARLGLGPDRCADLWREGAESDITALVP